MKIIISPAKKMRDAVEGLPPKTLPALLDKTKILLEYLCSLSYAELKALLACNDSLAREAYERFRRISVDGAQTSAILAYDGIQYKYMAPHVFEYGHFDYIEKHLCILSGLYGILRAFDAICPYRLEMQAQIKTDFCSSLYDFWGNSIYSLLEKECGSEILNLASSEYSRVVLPFVRPPVRLVNCTFGEIIGGKVREKGVYVKMARGEMVRFMAEQNIKSLDDIKNFTGLGFLFRQEFSDKNNFVFAKK